jgi:hypothetical protein
MDTPSGDIAGAVEGRLQAPLDKDKLAKLTAAFAELSTRKQSWLLQRFPHSETDVEATERLNDASVSARTIQDWKKADVNFMCCYNLLKGGMIDWEKHLAVTLEAGNALVAAMENRKILSRSWESLNAREASAKSTAINQTLTRVLPTVDRDKGSRKGIEDIAPED